MEEAEGIRDRFHLVAGLRFHIGVKERFADDGECQRGHLLMNVDFPVRLPALFQANTRVHHRVSVGGNTLAMKGWLHKSALPQVKPAFTGEQSLAQKGA